MIELLFLASQFQCGIGGNPLDIQVNVYQNQELVETMIIEDRVLLPVDSVKDLTFEYSIINNTAGCGLDKPTELVLNPNDELPTLSGFDEQDSVSDILAGLNEYQELFLVELGTTNQASAAFDLQDVTMRIDNNPIISLFAD